MSERDPQTAGVKLQAAITRMCSPDSFYWSCRDAEGLNLDESHEVETRLDIDPQRISTFAAPAGWKIVHTKPNGMVFMRRKQPLTDEAVRGMFVEMLTIAVAHDGQFYSWMHEPDLAAWD
ncbi:MAG TPA: hypothetical protein VMF58_18745 [Rhizomicrobium sp.]|nr:hypothetical protein [Rhizomicrobium sp.]